MLDITRLSAQNRQRNFCLHIGFKYSRTKHKPGRSFGPRVWAARLLHVNMPISAKAVTRQGHALQGKRGLDHILHFPKNT